MRAATKIFRNLADQISAEVSSSSFLQISGSSYVPRCLHTSLTQCIAGAHFVRTLEDINETPQCASSLKRALGVRTPSTLVKTNCHQLAHFFMLKPDRVPLQFRYKSRDLQRKKTVCSMKESDSASRLGFRTSHRYVSVSKMLV